MRPTENDTKISGDIDYALRQGEFQYVPLTETRTGTGYAKWYSRLLTTLVVTLGETEILYSQTDYVQDADTARLIIVTDEVVVIVDVTQLNEGLPQTVTRVVGRGSLESFEVAASTAIDQEGSAIYGWPGLVEVHATYTGLDETLNFTSTGYARGDTDKPGAILALLPALQRDLNR